MMGSAASSAGSGWGGVPRDSFKLLEAGKASGELATFGAGCYWGTEKYFVDVFGKQHPGALRAAAVGFMGGGRSATYEEVW